MGKATGFQALLDQQTPLIQDGQWQALEELWLERIAEIPSQPEFFKPWLQEMKRARALDRAESLVALVVENRLEAGRARDAMRILLIVLPSFPDSAVLQPLLVAGLKAQFAQHEQVEDFIRLAGVSRQGANLVNAYKQFREWTHFAPGQVFQHHHWGVGVVRSLDLSAGKLVIDFELETGKEMTVEGARKFLTWLEPKHILARRAKDPEALQALAEDRPTELIRLALAGQKGSQMRQSELKALLLGTVIEEKSWNSWWGRAREQLAVDPYIDFERSGGAHALLRLREKPRSFAEEIEEGFFDPEVSTAGRVELIRQLARAPKDTRLPSSLVRRIVERLNEEWELNSESSPVVRLEIAYMLEDLAQAVPDAQVEIPDVEDILDEITDYHDLFEIDHLDYGARALAQLIRRDGDEGIRQATSLLPEAPVKLAQAIWQTMEKEHHIEQGGSALQRLFDNPLDNPDTFAWALRCTLDGTWKHLEDYFPAEAMVPELIDQMEQWQHLADDSTHPRDRRETARKLLSRGRTLLSADHFELLSLAVEGMPRETAARLRRQIQSHAAFNAAFKAQADRAIAVTRRDLEDPAEASEAASAADDAVFSCTVRAQALAMAELRDITSNRIPENARVIEEARMEGDLRENAGYQYAKEEQKMLVQRQATLSDLLRRARVIRAEDVDTRRIGFGTRFKVRNLDSGQDETYTLLGRWEADPERNVLNEQAPLARQFTGRMVGDKLRIERPGAPATNYEVLAIENALAGSEWESDVV